MNSTEHLLSAFRQLTLEHPEFVVCGPPISNGGPKESRTNTEESIVKLKYCAGCGKAHGRRSQFCSANCRQKVLRLKDHFAQGRIHAYMVYSYFDGTEQHVQRYGEGYTVHTEPLAIPSDTTAMTSGN